MEPDRAPSLLIHHTELAWQAAGQLPDDRAADRCDYHPHRPAGTVRHRRCSISGRCEGVRCRDGRPQAHAPRIPWRVELHYRTKVATLIAVVIVQQALSAREPPVAAHFSGFIAARGLAVQASKQSGMEEAAKGVVSRTPDTDPVRGLTPAYSTRSRLAGSKTAVLSTS